MTHFLMIYALAYGYDHHCTMFIPTNEFSTHHYTLKKRNYTYAKYLSINNVRILTICIHVLNASNAILCVYYMCKIFVLTISCNLIVFILFKIGSSINNVSSHPRLLG